MEILKQFTTRKGIIVQLKKSEEEGVSLYWEDEAAYKETHCYDYGETVPTKHKFRNKEVEKLYERITDEQIVIDLFNKIKRKKWLNKLDFSDVSSIVYQHLKQIYDKDCVKYYSKGYID